MIEFINGDIVASGKDYVILNNSGIGYYIIMPTSSIGFFLESFSLPVTNVTVYTHLQLREDAISLYGFHSEMDREIFRLLLSVNKVGPKAAVSILSHLTSHDLIQAITTENAALIAKSQGIGIKTAQKIILELNDKIKKYAEVLLGKDTNYKADEVKFEDEEISDTIEALVSLGYTMIDAKRAVKKAAEDNFKKGQLLSVALKYI